MTCFKRAKQILENEAYLERRTSKKETSTNGKRTKYLLFWKPKYTQLENEEPSPPVKGSAINQNGSVNLKCDYSLKTFALSLGSFAHCTVGHLENETSSSGREEYSRGLHF